MSSTRRRFFGWVSLLTLALLAGGCDGCRKNVRDEYFRYLEKVGFEKRDLLVKRVDKAKEAQEEAQEQFEDALEEFQALIGHDGGDLETMYDSLKSEYDDAEGRAEEVRDRIQKIENVAGSLFDEWRQEIAQFDNKTYRRESEKKLRETQGKYEGLLRTMKKAAGSMDPVLDKLRDQVLYLKHNLNAQALGSLDQQVGVLQDDVSELIADIQASVAEADRFIAEMSAAEPG
ncbi:MAG: DUF2959 domain-containing protein [Acidobacteriota bacterium]